MALALSHGGDTTVTCATPSGRVLVGTIDGIAELKRDGSSWRVASRMLEGNHVHAILLEEQSGMWFAGVNKGGIFSSSDDGATWDRCDNGITEPDIYSLASAEINGKVRLFAGTEPAHLFVSDDLGKSWSELTALRDVESVEKWTFPAPPHIGHVKHINFAPGNPHTIFASIEQGALLKSTDDGELWVDIVGMNDDVHRTVIDPERPERMYVTGGWGLWVTDDEGASWENTYPKGSEPGGYPDQLVFKPSDPSYMLMSAGQNSPSAWRTEHTAKTRISRSRDSGATWEILLGGLTDYMKHSIEAMVLEESGSTVQVFAATTGGEVLWSEDGGDNWSTIVEGLPPISKGGHYRGMVEQPV